MSHPVPTSEDQRPLLQQAPVVPLDASGLMASIIGTVIFAIATIVCWLGDSQSRWLSILVFSTVVGVLLIVYTAWHRQWARHRTARRQNQGEDR